MPPLAVLGKNFISWQNQNSAKKIRVITQKCQKNVRIPRNGFSLKTNASRSLNLVMALPQPPKTILGRYYTEFNTWSTRRGHLPSNPLIGNAVKPSGGNLTSWHNTYYYHPSRAAVAVVPWKQTQFAPRSLPTTQIYANQARRPLRKMPYNRPYKKYSARRHARRAALRPTTGRQAYYIPPRMGGQPFSGFNGIEKKYLDFAGNNAVINNSWGSAVQINTLVAMPQGNTASERVGRKIRLESISVQFEMKQPTQASVGQSGKHVHGFMALVWDKQCNKLAATPSQIYLDQVPDYYKLRNLNFSERFQVLWKKNIVWQSPATRPWKEDGGSAINHIAALSYTVRKFTKLGKYNIDITYDSSGTTVGTVTTNNLLLMAWNNSDYFAKPTAQYHIRLRYVG